jgi:hypothetical protein
MVRSLLPMTKLYKPMLDNSPLTHLYCSELASTKSKVTTT